MTHRRVCSTCAVLGLTACLHLNLLDADHVHHIATQPIVVTESLPPPTHPDDGPHNESAGIFGIVDANVTVSGTSSAAPEPATWPWWDAARLYRARERERQRAAHIASCHYITSS